METARSELAVLWSSEDGPNIVLGVDGGGTKTTCVAILAEEKAGTTAGSSDASILGRGISGSSNHNSVGAAVAKKMLESAMDQALRQARVPPAAVKAVCVGMAGVDRPADVELVRGWLRAFFAGDVLIVVHNDAVAALASGTGGDLYGTVLISGTGTIAVGFSRDGATARASGAGPALGDKGSGHAVATDALSAVMRAYDGRGPPTALTAEILKQLGLSSPTDLIGWAYEDPSWARVAALAPAVKACAAQGDSVARRIVCDAAHELAWSVHAVVSKLNLAGPENKEEFPLVLVGGVLQAGDLLTKHLLEELQSLLPTARPVHPSVEPAIGAAMLARVELSKITLDKSVSGPTVEDNSGMEL